MDTLFLKAKHWQLFILHFVLPIFCYIFALFYSIYKIKSVAINNGDFEELSFMISYMKFVFLIVFCVILLLTMWMYYVTTSLHELIPKESSFKINRFKFILFVPLFLIPFTVLIGYLVFKDFTVSVDDFSPYYIIGAWLVIMLVNFIIMICNIHSIFYTARTLKTVELNRKVGFGDFIGEFFLIMFFPIGVWIIQPKINAFVSENFKEVLVD